jgi:L-lactate dehydrogenase complex protein LldE
VRIALFTTCLVDAVFPQAARATVLLLERLGHEVDVPAGQACCGQMHINSGFQKQALPIVRNHVRTFAPVLDGEWDAVVAPSGSCVAATHHQQAMVARRAGDEQLAGLADAVAARTYELSQLLVDVLGLSDVGAWFPHAVTYHPTCHSMRMLRVGDRPTRLLRAVADLELRDLPEADSCCGFGGTFALKNSETSGAMVSDKVRNIASTGAPYVTAGDWSCLMNISGALDRQGTGVRALHLAEILASTRDDPWRPVTGRPDVAGARVAGRTR